MHQEERNHQVRQPLDDANKMVKKLQEEKARHSEIKTQLDDC